MKIPEDMYSHVFELSTQLMNASKSEDLKSYWRFYDELRLYCEEESKSGRDHPFLWETLADFTNDNGVAVALYEKALDLANRSNAVGYQASIQIALAERFKDIGDTKQALKYALEANTNAKGLDDLDLRRQISEFLLSESKNI
ncbi:hypothetical protein ACEN8I_03345 [Polaromonas sp. CT11-55]|uniref:hypothetical protein n=1 Tax=Polaromonas sp. CT11-55 TaxID=3243045 RepID=UPI0039A43264